MTQLNLNTVRQNIEARLATEMANNPAITVVFGNQPFKPTANNDFIQCLIEFTGSNYITLGGTNNSTNSQTGIITFNIFTKVGVGLGNNLTLAKRIRDLYNRVILNDIYFEPPTGPAVLENASPEGFVQSVMSIAFETFENL
tara:strand:- start:54 stop:479 length:426 start_codon:yes stop_codon:yes gene_type:complete